MPSAEYDLSHRRHLLRIARESIAHGLVHQRALELALDGLPPLLHEMRACFVTLTLEGRLRGCIGSLEPRRALAEDVARNAFDTAFSDPRFDAVRRDEFATLEIEISVLSPLRLMTVTSEAQLLEELRPHEDGLVLEDDWRRATFLPKVWEALATPADFVGELKRKAGMAPDHWSPSLRVYRYHTEIFGERDVCAG